MKGFHPDQLPAEERRAFHLTLELVEAEKVGQVIPMVIGPYSAFTLIGALQLVMRNAAVNGTDSLSGTLRTLCDMFAEPFRDHPLWETIQKGYDPAHDVDQAGRERGPAS